MEVRKILKIWKPEIIQLPFNVFDQRLIKSKIIDHLYKKNRDTRKIDLFTGCSP